MTTEAYARATARESRIWKPFEYSFPFDTTQTAERTITYGLYANSYLNGQRYLTEVEAEDLANLLADYNAKIADLTTKGQLVASEIISRRYLASVDKIIHDKKMETKRSGIEADEDLWDAKMEALSADRAALETMAEKVSTETEKTGAKITEIQAYIEIEALRLTEADIEVAQKEIQAAKVDIEKLNTQNQILKTQIDTVEAAQELVEVDLKIARTRISSAEVDRASNKIDLLDSELSIEQAKTDIAEAEVSVAQERVALAQAKTDEAQAEVDHLATEEAQVETAYQNKIDLMDLQHTSKEEAITMRREAADLALENRLALSELEIALTNADSTLQPQLDSARVAQLYANAGNKWILSIAEINAQQTLAAAKIGTTLTHSITKA